MKQIDNNSEQAKSDERQRLEEERSKLVVYTVKLPNGVKFTRLGPLTGS